MERKIIYKEETENSVMMCRNLCDSLMQYQASKASSDVYREILGAMCFETRLLPKFQNSDEKQLIVAYDNDIPVGYIFSLKETVTQQGKDARPAWVSKLSGGTNGFYPESLNVPVRAGDVNNLFVLPEYRGHGIGKQLMEQAMNWLTSSPDLEWLFVNISNGNNAAPFYERYGFKYSHDVMGGIIRTYCRKLQKDS